jgi:hypothetical protein
LFVLPDEEREQAIEKAAQHRSATHLPDSQELLRGTKPLSNSSGDYSHLDQQTTQLALLAKLTNG